MSKIKDYEKLIAFLVLVGAIVALALQRGSDAPGSVLRDVLLGLLPILGGAAQALFRISEGAPDMNKILKAAVDKLPPATGEAKETVDEQATLKSAEVGNALGAGGGIQRTAETEGGEAAQEGGAPWTR